MSYDYAGQVVSINALSRDAHPTEYELCAVHTELLTVPRGWKISLGDGAPIRPRSMDVVDFAAFVAQRAASA